MKEELPVITGVSPEELNDEVWAIFCSGKCEDSVFGLITHELAKKTEGNLVLGDGENPQFTEITVSRLKILDKVVSVLIANPIANRDLTMVDQIGHKIKLAIIEIKDSLSDKAKRQADLVRKIQEKTNGSRIGIYGISEQDIDDLELVKVRRLEYQDVMALIDGKQANR